MDLLDNCNLCPRHCGINRHISSGFCGCMDKPIVARAALHFWEEPCISGENGSGTVFFSGCNLKCVYCQNYKISRECFGKEISVERLAEIFLELQEKKAENINLVTPTQFVMHIIEALDIVKAELNIPVIYNCGGYEDYNTIKMFEDYVDIYLTDVKYFSDELSAKYSGVRDYFVNAVNALVEMVRQKPNIVIKDGMMKSGVIVRHLVLPTHRNDSLKILSELKNRFGTDSFLISLMSQYTPYIENNEYKELNRKITSFEYKSVVNKALELGFVNGFMQQKSSAMEEYTPEFDLYGVIKDTDK